MDHGGVALVGFFVARGDVTELFKIAEQVFDGMTQFVHVKNAGNLAGTVGLRKLAAHYRCSPAGSASLIGGKISHVFQAPLTCRHARRWAQCRLLETFRSNGKAQS